MPKKKAVAKATKKTATKKVIAKKTPVKKTMTKKSVIDIAKKPKKTAAVAKTSQKPQAAAAKKKTAVASPPAAAPEKVEKPEISLGRPLVTQEEKLYMLFHEDYLARQVFEFLRVETVKELEQFSQQQIIHMMTKPLRTTVDRIRQRLAQFKRSLKDDEQFAAEFRKQSEQS